MGCGSSKTAIKEESRPAEASPQPSQPQAEPSPSPRPAAATSTSRGGLREASDKPHIIFVIGGPGSGKGTQCEKIVEKYGGGFRHLSTGDLLRAEVKKGSQLGKDLEGTMRSGALVSDEQVITLLEKEISASAWFGMAYLVDGFPRAVAQAQQFEQRIRPCDFVLYFDCPEPVMIQRLTERGKSSGRADDNAETVQQRLRTFQKESLPVVKFYQEKQRLHQISAVPPPDIVFQEVIAILNKHFSIEAPDSSPNASEWRPSAVVDIENRYYGAREAA